MLDTPLQIASLTLPNRVLLAPLAGVTDVPFRRLCRELGAGLTFVEMLASNAVLQGNRRTLRTMQRHGDERILGVQVTGAEADSIARAAARLDAEGFDLVDLNMGCPVKKIVAKGWGSALLPDPEKVHGIVRASRNAVRGPLSVKIRLGMSREQVVVKEIAAAVAEAGADMLTIHGRTRDETYEHPVDLDQIRLGLETARAASTTALVTVGNGDILDVAAAQRMAEATGCDAVMVSRGALGNPWLFREIVGNRPCSTTLQDWAEGVFRHLDYHEAYYGQGLRSAVLARKHLAWYARGFPAIRDLRARLSLTVDLAEARRDLEAFTATLPPDTLRYRNGLQAERADSTAPFDPKTSMDREHDRAAADDGCGA